MDHEIAQAGLTSLMVQTAKRPVYGTAQDRDRIACIDAALLALGWQLGRSDGLLGVAEAAAILSLSQSEKNTRRLFPHKIPASKVDGEWRCAEADVLAFAKRLTGHQQLVDVARRADVDYHTVYRTLQRLGLEADADKHTRRLMVTVADAERIVGELDRIRRLHARAVKVANAAAILRTSESMIHRWARTGRLAYDAESDAGGGKFVTRESMEREKRNRMDGRRPNVPIVEFKALTGFEDVDVKALVAAGLLVRVRPSGLTPESVRSWVVGHRPQLLGSDLVRRLSA